MRKEKKKYWNKKESKANLKVRFTPLRTLVNWLFTISWSLINPGVGITWSDSCREMCNRWSSEKCCFFEPDSFGQPTVHLVSVLTQTFTTGSIMSYGESNDSNALELVINLIQKCRVFTTRFTSEAEAIQYASPTMVIVNHRTRTRSNSESYRPISDSEQSDRHHMRLSPSGSHIA